MSGYYGAERSMDLRAAKTFPRADRSPTARAPVKTAPSPRFEILPDAVNAAASTAGWAEIVVGIRPKSLTETHTHSRILDLGYLPVLAALYPFSDPEVCGNG
jgi:hypothetical protein